MPNNKNKHVRPNWSVHCTVYTAKPFRSFDVIVFKIHTYKLAVAGIFVVKRVLLSCSNQCLTTFADFVVVFLSFFLFIIRLSGKFCLLFIFCLQLYIRFGEVFFHFSAARYFFILLFFNILKICFCARRSHSFFSVLSILKFAWVAMLPFFHCVPGAIVVL